ncbi:MAG: ABC transporter substrate-binding protein [Nocardioides sp.]|uniref:ABC transporter substrate-binding protein n=1 Tax=Nocardioides sp. TaxID=35761 RepID=UPI00239ACC57|nr:ABC transporter substrate-binding protein [Nocardioides sp.]MDE0776446.1 ABC transporter substrate-binding protein [Nocardioides sp.]
MTRPHRRHRAVLTGLAGVLVLAGCGGGEDATVAETAPSSDWEAVLAEADGQSVNWYMYGGDDTLNAFVDDVVTPRLADLGVSLNQVRIDDTAEAVNKVLGEKQAGRTEGGSVDAIWINGENFATGVQADLWRCGWSQDLPNARYVDLDAPEVATDFGTPVDGCEAAWQQANSALVYDSAVLDEDDVASVDSLFAWAEADPGRLAYPAPPDFFGSMAVRTVLYDTIGGPDSLLDGEPDPSSAAFTDATAATFERLNEIEPSLWRGGETYPQSQDDIEKLYSDGEISAFFTYGPGAVGTQVADGLYPDSTREAVLSVGNISNVSFVTIPANAAHQAGALVHANDLQEPEVQLALFEANGVYPAIDVASTPTDVQDAFAAVETSPSVLPLDELLADARPELASAYLAAIEDGWVAEVQQK